MARLKFLLAVLVALLTVDYGASQTETYSVKMVGSLQDFILDKNGPRRPADSVMTSQCPSAAINARLDQLIALLSHGPCLVPTSFSESEVFKSSGVHDGAVDTTAVTSMSSDIVEPSSSTSDLSSIVDSPHVTEKSPELEICNKPVSLKSKVPVVYRESSYMVTGEDIVFMQNKVGDAFEVLARMASDDPDQLDEAVRQTGEFLRDLLLPGMMAYHDVKPATT